MATGNFYCNANGDGNIWAGSTVWSTVRGAATGNVSKNSTTDSCRARLSGSDYYIDRFFFPFDTSTLPTNCTIDSATLSVYVDNCTADARYWCLVQTTQASSTNIVSGDFNEMGTTEGATRVLVHAAGWLDFTLDATGLGWINRDGPTFLGLRDDKDLDNSAPTNDVTELLRTSDYADSAYYPVLAVTYTEYTTTSSSTSTSSTSTSSTSSSSSTSSTSISTSSTSISTSSTSTSSTSISTTSTSTSTTATTIWYTPKIVDIFNDSKPEGGEVQI